MPSSKSNQMKASYLTRCAMMPLYLCKLWFWTAIMLLDASVKIPVQLSTTPMQTQTTLDLTTNTGSYNSICRTLNSHRRLSKYTCWAVRGHRRHKHWHMLPNLSIVQREWIRVGWSHRGITLSWGLIKPAQSEGLRLPPHTDIHGETKNRKIEIVLTG